MAKRTPAHPHAAALAHLAEVDLHIAAALAQVGLPPLRERPPGFAGLARIIVGQQLAVASAQSVWAKVTAALDPFTPATVLACSHDRLRACGLSRQKATYIAALADALASGRLDLEAVAALDDEAAIAQLMKVHGFGRWSAEIYLLFSLGRIDIWPAGDLALAIAVQRLKRLRKRPDPVRLRRLAERWRPYRGAAAFFLWHYYAKAPFADR